jgi:alkyldihydroxyacetonephosphate synthase
VTRSWWGWGTVEDAACESEVGELVKRAAATLPEHDFTDHPPLDPATPWYDRQRPDPFVAALRGAKAAVDPTGILNPGVLLDQGNP